MVTNVSVGMETFSVPAPRQKRTFEEILEHFPNARRSGKEFIAHCPCSERHNHGDENPSLGITEQNGRVLLHCHSQQCDAKEICERAGLTLADLNLNGATPRVTLPKTQPEPEKIFRAGQEDIERYQLQLAVNSAAQKYIEERGISLKVATELGWGYSPRFYAIEYPEEPSITFPHYDHCGKLIAIKFKAIRKDKNGKSLVSQFEGSKNEGLYGLAVLDRSREEVAVFEGAEDVALALTHGFNAVGITSATAKLNDADVNVLRTFKQIYLIGDQDKPGREAMQALQQKLPAGQVLRVGRLAGFKDVGELWKSDPGNFTVRLKRILRIAQASRIEFSLSDALLASEVRIPGFAENDVVEKLIPACGISMFYAEEKSGKSLFLTYLGKCICNGKKVLGKYATRKMPVLGLDLDSGSKDIADYNAHFEGLGPEEIRYFNRETGVPSLDSPALVRICEQQRPLLILESFSKFAGRETGTDGRAISMFDPAHVSRFFDKLLNLTAAGATIIISHHSQRADSEKYSSSHQIGAAVVRSYVLVSEDRPKLHRVRLEGQLARGGEALQENLIAFPVISEHGEFGLAEPEKSAAVEEASERVTAFIADFKRQNERGPTREEMKRGLRKRRQDNARAVQVAIDAGRINQDGAGFWHIAGGEK